MKNVIYYFSGTGNSLSVARALADELGETELLPIASVKDKSVAMSAERVGIVFPVYMWGMPLIVKNFLERLEAGITGTYCFAVVTCGGQQGTTLLKVAELLAGRGVRLSAGFVVKMPGNYTPMYGAISDRRQQQLFADARAKIGKIAATVKARESGMVEKDSPLANILSRFFYPFASPKIPVMDRNFWTDDNCDGCGFCARVCPVRNITMSGGKPAWQHRCQQCLACLQWCPKEALQSGKHTPGRRRYRHPGITLPDIEGMNGQR